MYPCKYIGFRTHWHKQQTNYFVLKAPQKTLVLGLMSGTSLDGVDLALCAFSQQAGKPQFKILKAKTIAYTTEWKKRLEGAKSLHAEEYFALHAQYGKFLGQCVNRFLKQTATQPVAIASHGHTIFHQPRRGFSTQLGCGATLAATSGITTVCDFRSLDVALGGQGAPLVPIGDALLFNTYDACLNLGGIANISYTYQKKRLAYDVCGANMLLNHLSALRGKDYDKGGKMAAAGKLIPDLLKALNQLPFFTQKGARSLGREWFEQDVLPLFELSQYAVEDLLATCCEHIAQVLAKELNKHAHKAVLVTGGGAFNTHLMDLLREKTKCRIIIPDKQTVAFKEAIIFAFLGYLRLQEKTNTLASVTGAQHNSVGGAVYLGKR